MSGDLGNRNWFRDIQCFEGTAPAPATVEEVQAILRDPQRFPSPVRPMGSRHSMTACMAAQVPGSPGRWGTAIDMSRFKGEIRVDKQAMTATLPAGLTFFEAAHELRRSHGVQFRVNTELGTLTMGAAACGATKDSSFPDEPGQVCHDVIGMRLVKPDGEVVVMREGEADFDALRCSYGLFGVVTELTFRVAPHENISIRHEELELGEFEQRRRQWMADGQAVFLYLFPYARPPRIVAELRGKGASEPASDFCLRLAARNFFWGKGLHLVADLVQHLPAPLAAVVGEAPQKIVREFLKMVDIRAVSPVDQIVDFAADPALLQGPDRFTFSMWAFPTAREGRKPFAQVLEEYFAFCRSPQAHGLRTVLPHVSYHISKDQSSMLSYSHDSDVWTLDPIASGKEPGWEPFLRAFNERCCDDWRGVPLFNQTPLLTRNHVVKAFGERLVKFEAVRRRFDPQDRMLNQYFKTLLQD